jgi:TBC domain-containing protein kinase-like protein
MSPIPLVVLKTERCPQLSAEDLIELLDLSGTKFVKPKIIVVDVRSAEK